MVLDLDSPALVALLEMDRREDKWGALVARRPVSEFEASSLESHRRLSELPFSSNDRNSSMAVVKRSTR